MLELSLGLAMLVTAFVLAKKKNRLDVFWILFCIILPPIAIIILLFVAPKTRKSFEEEGKLRPVEINWVTEVQDLPYKHFWKGYGIAVDPQKEQIHLKSLFGGVSVEKIYSFSEIREWSYNIEKGIQIHLDGTSGLILFLRVKDIDLPEWQIKFAQKIELKRWMEILLQHIND